MQVVCIAHSGTTRHKSLSIHPPIWERFLTKKSIILFERQAFLL